MKNNWFATWFDSKYYHILYQHRDDAEAHFFIDNLIQYLHLPKQAAVLDLACGKGRHSIYLAQKNLEVTGVDLSPESIAHAKQSEKSNLQFHTHDMREPINFGSFDAIFNLFTSFGYFDTEEEHLQTLQSMKNGRKKSDGTIVIDFFNAYKVIQNLVLEETKTLDNITFQLRRWVENGAIIKQISFEDKGQKFQFQEKVHAFSLEQFQQLFDQVGLKIIETFGDYSLSSFDKQTSDRLIMILQ